MDSMSSEQQKISIKNPNFHTSEQTNTKIDVLRKNVPHQKYFRDEQHSPDSSQNAENYQTRHSMNQNCFGNSSPYEDKYPFKQIHERNISLKPIQQDNNLEQTFLLPEENSVYNVRKYANSNRPEGEMYNSKLRRKLEEECEQNYTFYQKSREDKNYQTPCKKIIYQNKVYDIGNNSSYICQPINCKRDTVRINDLVVKDNLILKCRPRNQDVHQSLIMKQNYEESGSINGYFYPKTEEENNDSSYEGKNYRFGEKPLQEQPLLTNLGESTLVRHDTHGLGTPLFLQDQNHLELMNQNEKSEVERVKRCTKLSYKFRGYLWVLFFISVILVIIGFTLMIYILSHFATRNYINIVIQQTGFVKWVWAMMILSAFIIIVGVYGIITSIDRGKYILIAFSLAAFILAMLILLFLVFLCVMFVNMKYVEHTSMRNTFKMYRCNRYIRNAWDDLQQTHKCCGIEDQGDWKYIPPSCCNATAKKQKIDCVKHYISEDQAYEAGCRVKIEDYFTAFFFKASVLLILGFVLLLICIFVALWLLKKYRRVEKCQEVYFISR